MTDSLFDDVKALLENDFGDDRILKQIYRAYENNEIISNYERNYVKKLAEQHLGKRSEIVQTPRVVEKPIVPDVILPQTRPMQTQTVKPKSSLINRYKPKSRKVMVGIGVVLIVIIAIAVSAGLSSTTPSAVSDELSIQTDLSSYAAKDIISISGTSNTDGTVSLSIENKNNELVWTEQVSLKRDGLYSTLAIAGGAGWESSGTYTIKVDNGVTTKSNTFSFTA